MKPMVKYGVMWALKRIMTISDYQIVKRKIWVPSVTKKKKKSERKISLTTIEKDYYFNSFFNISNEMERINHLFCLFKRNSGSSPVGDGKKVISLWQNLNGTE